MRKTKKEIDAERGLEKDYKEDEEEVGFHASIVVVPWISRGLESYEIHFGTAPHPERDDCEMSRLENGEHPDRAARIDLRIPEKLSRSLSDSPD